MVTHLDFCPIKDPYFTIPPSTETLSTPLLVLSNMLRRSRCVLIFLEIVYSINRFTLWAGDNIILLILFILFILLIIAMQ